MKQAGENRPLAVKAEDFNLRVTLESGQIFGFSETEAHYFAGSILGHPVQISQQAETLFVESKSGVISSDLIRSYFDLDRNLKPVYQFLEEEPRFLVTLKKFRGLRLIRQDAWEALAGFIISANNNVKRIQEIWKRLSETCCENKLLFPSAKQLSGLNEKALREIGLGYRAPYLLKTAQRVVQYPDELNQIRGLGYEQAVGRLIQYPGVGRKVADCVLLYGFHRLEAFPVDVWIGRLMRNFYFRGRKVSDEKIGTYARKKWGTLTGYVQQYLFHAARMNVIDL